MESAHLRPAFRNEGDVHRRLRAVARTKPELRPPGAAEACPSVDLLHQPDAQWFERGGIESLAGCVVADAKANVVKGYVVGSCFGVVAGNL